MLADSIVMCKWWRPPTPWLPGFAGSSKMCLALLYLAPGYSVLHFEFCWKLLSSVCHWMAGICRRHSLHSWNLCLLGNYWKWDMVRLVDALCQHWRHGTPANVWGWSLQLLFSELSSIQDFGLACLDMYQSSLPLLHILGNCGPGGCKLLHLISVVDSALCCLCSSMDCCIIMLGLGWSICLCLGFGLCTFVLASAMASASACPWALWDPPHGVAWGNAPDPPHDVISWDGSGPWRWTGTWRWAWSWREAWPTIPWAKLLWPVDSP